ncbi:uncharacterized protein [Ptychodera flava]|uniref:uncharacterized protein isoform X2 n=1 Tax=Ptychodera flava TaxID=63121 RepID=UPI003969C360
MVTCLVCGGEIVDETPSIQLYDSRLSVCHVKCFTCCKCSSALTRSTYQLGLIAKKLYCETHYVCSFETQEESYLKELRQLKSMCLGYAVARRKSSTAFQIQVPAEACSCHHAHNIRQVPGYWVECWESEDGDEGVVGLDSSEVSLTSYDQEIYGKHFYGSEHWNYFTEDDTLGPITLSLKLEAMEKREYFRILIRTQTGISHGLLPIGYLPANRYDRDDIIKAISAEIGLSPTLKVAQLSFASAPDELIKLDQVFVKSELKVGIVYIKNGQVSEEEIFGNCEHSYYFDEFLDVLGMKVKLKGFTGYRGGLDTVNDFTGKTSVYTKWKDIEIMYHVSTLLPYEGKDPQKLQRKRHIGNDILCVVFLDPGDTEFIPNTIKSHFLHTFVVVKPVSTQQPLRFAVSIVSRDEVPAYNPPLSRGHVFEKGPTFREWILTKVVNGERACYTAPKFARMQDRTRLQMLEELVGGFQVHLESLHGRDIRKLQSRRGSWLPISYCRPPTPLGDIIKDRVEGQDQLSKDFAIAFRSSKLCDIIFIVGKDQVKLHGVRAILAVRSRVFQEMLYGKVDVSTSPIPEPKISSAPNSPVTKKTFIRVGSRKCNSHHDILKRASSEGAKDYRDSHNGLESVRTTSSLHNLSSDKSKQNVATPFFNPEKNKLHKNQVCPIFQKLERYLNFESARELLQRILSMPEILTENLLRQPEFVHLPMSIMQHIMSREIKVSEIVKFNALLKWAKNYSHKFKVSKIGIMNSMAEYIKFHLIEPSDLMKIVVPSKCVPSEKIIMSLAFHVDPDSVADLQQVQDGSDSDSDSHGQ